MIWEWIQVPAVVIIFACLWAYVDWRESQENDE